MNLTQADLQAISDLLDQRVPKLVKPLVNEAIEESDRRTAAGFAEVYEKIDALSDDIKAVDYKVDQAFEATKRVEDKVDASMKQTSENASFISKMKTVLR